MTSEIYEALDTEDFPMKVINRNRLYENIEFVDENKGDFAAYGYRYIDIIEKNNRLSIFKGNKSNL